MVNDRCVFTKWVFSGLVLMGFLSGSAFPLGLPATQSRDHTFIAYWPPAENSNGLRLAVKDLIDVKGVVTTAGSEYVAKNSPPAARDAGCLSIARARNVQIVGKTNLSEFAISPSGINDHYGTPKNHPWRLVAQIYPGRFFKWFSGGDHQWNGGYCVWNGYGRVVRVPAACCGIVGLKTTFGLIPLDGVFPVEPKHLDTVGPMGNDVARVAEGMDLLQNGFAARYRAAMAARPSAGPIKIGRVYLKSPNPGNLAMGVTDVEGLLLSVTDLKSLFFGVTNPEKLSLGGTDPRIDKAVDEALAKAQFQVTPLDQEFRAKWRQAQKDSNIVGAVGAWMSNQKYQFKPGVSARANSVILLGKILQTEYRGALQRQADWQRTLSELFEKVYFIALPTLQTLPLTIPLVGSPALLEARVLALQNTSAVNLAGNPARPYRSQCVTRMFLSLACNLSDVSLARLSFSMRAA